MTKRSRFVELTWLAIGVAVLAACVAAPVKMDDVSLEAKARAIHARILSVDTHCDTPMNMLRGNWDIGQRHEPGKSGSGLIDLPRMKEGCLDALFFGAFVGQGELSPQAYAKAKERADQLIAAVDAMCVKYPDLVEKATTPGDAWRIKATGKRIAFLGMENGYPIGTDLSLIEAYAKKGVRYITLCHGSDNQICDSGTERRNPEDKGLSEFGRKVVAECNRWGIMVDVSHMSDKSFFDVLQASRAPIFASHSCCRALCDNPRNLTDDMIKALARKGGVIQMCFLSAYLKAPKPNPDREKALKELEAKYGPRRALQNVKDEALRVKATQEYQAVMQKFPDDRASVKDIVDHIEHVIKLVGVDYIGIGTDFDGGGGVSDCGDVSQMFRVTMELLRRGYNEKEIGKIWGGNIMRVLQKVIDAAA
ncbi:MAG: dipeptidase [Candidatus Aminicenantes bacterium]|nr:dipeptidase [Candidatus Aminicenantes bacterium]